MSGNANSAKGNPAFKRMMNPSKKNKRLRNKQRNELFGGSPAKLLRKAEQEARMQQNLGAIALFYPDVKQFKGKPSRKLRSCRHQSDKQMIRVWKLAAETSAELEKLRESGKKAEHFFDIFRAQVSDTQEA